MKTCGKSAPALNFSLNELLQVTDFHLDID